MMSQPTDNEIRSLRSRYWAKVPEMITRALLTFNHRRLLGVIIAALSCVVMPARTGAFLEDRRLTIAYRMAMYAARIMGAL